jgi:hypothetical protein
MSERTLSAETTFVLAVTAAPRYKGSGSAVLMTSFLPQLKICLGWARFERGFEEPSK